MFRWIVGSTGFFVTAFGLGCLNYTFGDGIEHHREVARRNNWPEPSQAIFYSGAASVALGAGAVGYALGRKGNTST